MANRVCYIPMNSPPPLRLEVCDKKKADRCVCCERKKERKNITMLFSLKYITTV